MKVSLLLLAVLCAVSLAQPRGNAKAGTKPNIVFIMGDDMGYYDVGFKHEEKFWEGKTSEFYTNGRNHLKSRIQTPNLDKLRNNGVHLEQHYGMQLCTPSRAALMTGRYPMRYGMQSFVITPGQKYGLPLKERTLPEALREAGYSTKMVGKWHLGHADTKFWPINRGFDSHYGLVIGNVDYFTHERGGQLDWQRDGVFFKEEGLVEELLNAEAERVILEHDEEKPLFLYFAHLAAHSAYQGDPSHWANYAESCKDDPIRGNYSALIEHMDEGIGKVVAALKKKGMYENTIIVFASDNGGVETYDPVMAAARKVQLPTPAQNSPSKGSKASLYEGGVKTIAVASWPGVIEPGSTISDIVHMVDWFPTFLTLAGGKFNEGDKKFDGADILPTVQGMAPSPHADSVLINAEMHRGAVRMGDFKIVKKATLPSKVEVYNLRADPGETKNLYGGNPELDKKLERELNIYASQMQLSLYMKSYMPYIQQDTKKAAGLKTVEEVEKEQREREQQQQEEEEEEEEETEQQEEGTVRQMGYSDPLDFSTVEDGGVEGEFALGLPLAKDIEGEEKEKKKGLFHWLKKKNPFKKGRKRNEMKDEV